MNSTFSSARQKLVLALTLLGFIMIASILIWHSFGEQNLERRKKTSKKIGALIPGFLTEEPSGSVLAEFGGAPEFSFIERSGRQMSKKDLLGKPWVADFIFTSCAGQCPLMSMEMRRLQGLFPKESGLQFVSVTVDPDRDKPEVLADYANRYEADKDRWFFLTGEKNEINRVLKEFFLSPVDQPAMHSVRFILVDQDGKIRGYYDSSEPAGIKQLIHDAKILTAKSSSPQ